MSEDRRYCEPLRQDEENRSEYVVVEIIIGSQIPAVDPRCALKIAISLKGCP